MGALCCRSCFLILPLPTEIPISCGQCGATGEAWWKLLPHWREGEPRVAYELTWNDRRWLRSLRIAADEEA